MRIAELHPWDLGPEEAARIQEKLAHRVRASGPNGPVRTVCGADVHVQEGTARAACVVLELPGLWLRARAVHSVPARFPYIPGLLSFREIPPLIPALEELPVTPDVLLVDGHGLAHPRGFGLACHLGVLARTPCVGCAKSLLVGSCREPAGERGSSESLYHRGRVVGAAVRTRTGVKPVYVSPGHLISLERSVELVLACAPRFRVPEPLRLAHRLAASGKTE
ncbi:MAG: endonuclease V [Spirochaetota bacterium]